MKPVYVVLQGAMSKSGTGDFEEIVRTTSKREAIKVFNAIKHDTTGWRKAHHLETWLMIEGEENPLKIEIKNFEGRR